MEILTPKISPGKYYQEILEFHATLTELLQSQSQHLPQFKHLLA